MSTIDPREDRRLVGKKRRRIEASKSKREDALSRKRVCRQNAHPKVPTVRRFDDGDEREKEEEKKKEKEEDVDDVVSDFCARLAPGGSAERSYRTVARKYWWPQNIVTNVKLGTSVDLRRLSAGHPNFYVPQRFEACVVRMMMGNLMDVGLVFRTASAVIVGTHSLAQTVKAAHTLRMHLMASGESTTFDSFRLSNMVYNTSVTSSAGINIAAINKKNADRTTYVPFMFPGLQYYAQIPDSRVACPQRPSSSSPSPSNFAQKRTAKMRVFDTGKIVIMGITNPRDVWPVLAEAERIARENPDAALPKSNKRFAHRVEQKRKAFCELSLAWTDIPGSDDIAQPREKK